MKMIWHIMKKDFRVIWPLWLIWLGLIVVRVGLVYYYLNSAGAPALKSMGVVAVCAIFADVLLILSIVRSVVQSDPLTGGRAFWLTRPIGRWQLLTAKATSAVLLCLVSPLVVLLPTWLSLGFGGEDLARALLYHCLSNGVACVVGFGFASVTGKAGSFWLWTLVVTGVVLAFLIVLAVALNLDRSLDQLNPVPWVTVGVAVVFAGALLQFWKRSTGASVICVIVGLVPTVFFQPELWQMLSEWEIERDVPDLVEFCGHDSYVYLQDFPSPEGRTRQVRWSFRMKPCVDGVERIYPRLVHAKWFDRDGGSVPAKGFGKERWARTWLWDLTLQSGGDVRPRIYCCQPFFLADALEKLKQPLESVGFAGRFEIKCTKTEQLADADVVPGTSSRNGGYFSRFLESQDVDGRVQIGVVSGAPSGSAQETSKFLTNAGEDLNYSGDTPGSCMLLWVRLEFRTLRKKFIMQTLKSHDEPQTADIRMLKTVERTVGYCERDLKVDGLTIIRQTGP